MAVEAKLTEQMPFVGTKTQAEVIGKEASRRGISKAQVVREAIDAQYGLVGGERPEKS